MKTLFILSSFLGFLLFSQVLHAGSGYFGASAGIKLGYQWSDKSSFIWGVELSCVGNSSGFDIRNLIYGIVLNVDGGAFGSKVHIGGQLSTLYAGVEVGPSFVLLKNDKTRNSRTGIGASAFTGALVYPFVSYTAIPETSPIVETGAILKYPFILSGIHIHM